MPVANILIFVRTASSGTSSASSRRLYLKTVYAGYAGQVSAKRYDVSPDETRPLPVAQAADHGTWCYIPFMGDKEINDIRLEFECSNLATEVVIVRGNKLLDVITRKEKDLSASSARTGAAPAQSKAAEPKATGFNESDEISDPDMLGKLKEDFMRTTQFLEETTRGYKSSAGTSEDH